MAYPNVKSGFTIRERGRANFGALFLAGKQFASKMNFAIAQGATSNITLVTMQLADKNNNPMAEDGGNCTVLDVYLSDSAVGAGITATTASGAVAAGSKGAVLATPTASKMLRVVTDVNGVFQLSITDTAKTLFYVCAVLPGTHIVVASRKLVAGDYK